MKLLLHWAHLLAMTEPSVCGGQVPGGREYSVRQEQCLANCEYSLGVYSRMSSKRLQGESYFAVTNNPGQIHILQVFCICDRIISR